jgi:hypothetical protein
LDGLPGDEEEESNDVSKANSISNDGGVWRNEDTRSEEPIAPPRPISKSIHPHQLDDIKEERVKKPRRTSGATDTGEGRRSRRTSGATTSDGVEERRPSRALGATDGADDKILKLSPSELKELESQPDSLPVQPVAQSRPKDVLTPLPTTRQVVETPQDITSPSVQAANRRTFTSTRDRDRPIYNARALTTPALQHPEAWQERTPRNPSPLRRGPGGTRSDNLDATYRVPASAQRLRVVSITGSDTSVPQEIPLPPLLSTYLQLELASSRPSALYIHRGRGYEYPFESTQIKFERLLNFLLVPVYLEPALLFGSLACLDAWLYIFTILPLRFVKAVYLLVSWWVASLGAEARFVADFVWHGSQRLWRRRRGRAGSVEEIREPRSRGGAEVLEKPPKPQSRAPSSIGRQEEVPRPNGRAASVSDRTGGAGPVKRHRRTRSIPSTLSPYHKADILQGLLVIFTCLILVRFDASRMYHSIRGQSSMKLYVIYNVLEVRSSIIRLIP